MTSLKAKYITLGCKLNFAETSSLADRLSKEGIERAADDTAADLCVINTCTVTETGNHKCRQAIHRAVRQNPDALVVVMGCYAQLCGEEIARMGGVDLVISMEDKARAVELILSALPEHRRRLASLKERMSAAAPLFSSTGTGDNSAETGGNSAETGDNSPDAQILRPVGQSPSPDLALHRFAPVPRNRIRTFVPSCSRGERTRFFLKVQDGCDNFCTYCAIPFARGRSRNGSVQSMVEQARQVVAQGGKEIVITGVNIGDFGRSTGETFFSLIRALDKVEGIRRYRISSIEPDLLTNEIIDFCARSLKFMPHFHIPLQSGSDTVLRLMRRRYDTALFRSRIDYINKVMPDAFIGVDVIVGTRGETAGLFDEAYSFCEGLGVSQYHVFSYSERPGTAALRIPYMVSEQEKHRRSQSLIALSEKKRISFYRKHIGQIRPVLTEHTPAGWAARGFTDNYIRVDIPSDYAPIPINTILNCRLDSLAPTADALIGVPVNP